MTGPRVNPSKEYPNLLHRYRVGAGLTLGRLAALANVSEHTVFEYQAGRTAPVFRTGQNVGQWRPVALRLCQVLGEDPATVFPASAPAASELTPTQVQEITCGEWAEPARSRRSQRTKWEQHGGGRKRRELVRSLGILTPLHLQALLLVKTAGFTAEEAAEILGIGAPSVDRLVEGARKQVERWRDAQHRQRQERKRAEAQAATLYKRRMAG